MNQAPQQSVLEQLKEAREFQKKYHQYLQDQLKMRIDGQSRGSSLPSVPAFLQGDIDITLGEVRVRRRIDEIVKTLEQKAVWVLSTEAGTTSNSSVPNRTMGIHVGEDQQGELEEQCTEADGQGIHVGEDQKPEFEEHLGVSDDYRSVTFRGEAHTLTLNQSKMLRVLCEAYEKGYRAVGKDKLLSAIENETSQVRDSWRKSPLWRSLILSDKRGTYRLTCRPVITR